MRITHLPAVHCAPPDAPPLVTLQPCAEHWQERTFDKYFFDLPEQGLVAVDSYTLLSLGKPGQWMLTFADGCVAHVAHYEFAIGPREATPALFACDTTVGLVFLPNSDVETHLFRTRFENRIALQTPASSPQRHRHSAPNTPHLVS